MPPPMTATRSLRSTFPPEPGGLRPDTSVRSGYIAHPSVDQTNGIRRSNGSGLFRRLSWLRATGRLGAGGYLIEPAHHAQHVRPSVSALFVFPCEVGRAGDKHHVQASAEGKTW